MQWLKGKSLSTMEAYSDGLNRRLGWLYACFGELYFCNNLGLIGNMGAFSKKAKF